MNDAVEQEPHAVTAHSATTIGRFVVLDRLGAGGMGVVFEAYDPRLDRRIALKILRYPDAEARTRLLREAQAMARLSHPSVVAVHEVGGHEGEVFIAMELVEGVPLGHWLTSRRRDASEIMAALVQAGRGLAAAHAAGIVHRDFKPDNVLVDESGRVRVTDFGLSRPESEDAVRSPAPNVAGRITALEDGLTEHGAIVGTPAYMSPEQIMGRMVGPASDQFSFCVTSWEALTGSRPFEAETIVDLAALLDACAPPTAGTPIAGPVAAALRRGLARDPQARWPSMDALLAELSRARLRQRFRHAAFGGVGVVAVGLAVSGWEAARRSAAITECERQAESMRSVWGPDAREELSRAFATTDVAGAADLGERVIGHLERYVIGLGDAAEAVCLDVVNESLAPEEGAARTRCLDARRDAVAVRVELVAEAAGRALLRAPNAVYGLPPVHTCVREEQLGLRTSAGTGPPDRLKVALRRLDRADVLGAFARFEEADRLASAVLSDARAWGATFLGVEANLLLGRLRLKTGEYDEARSYLHDAVQTALRVGHDDAAIKAMTKIAYLVRENESDGLPAADVAVGLVRRFDRTGTPLEADAIDTRGAVRYRRGEYDEAAADFERASALWVASVGARSEGNATSTMNLGNALLQLNDADAAAGKYEEAMAINEALFGPTHPNVAQCLANLGAVACRKGNDARCRDLVGRALELRKAVLGPEHPLVAESLVNLAEVLRMSGDADAAVQHARRAVEIRDAKLGRLSGAAVRAALELARALAAANRHSDAIALCQDVRRRQGLSPVLAEEVDAELAELNTRALGWVNPP